jgi:Zn-finger nucleic acid-binding protein
MASESPTLVTVPLERLRALEALEASLPEVIAKAKADAVTLDKKERLDKLTAPRKADPKAYSAEVLKKYHENKEEINARRREAYKAKKEAAAKPAPA